ncbi:hypothetical protein OO009_11920 [Flavobacteriaceae bacterium KMM 6897]|nr:hypothetical protein [Flavobacteriaceae bacterium KMM 6897]
MKKHYYLLIVLALIITSCTKDSATEVILAKNVFALSPVSNSNISGNVSFVKYEDGRTEVILQINNSSKDIHPAYIYTKSLAEGGTVALTLAPIECDCEESITVVSKLDNGTPITYEQLINFDGHLKIHQNEEHLELVIAQGNIGINAK